MEAAAPAYQLELVPMHCNKCEHLEEPHGVPVHHTTVLVNVPPPEDYIVWSICSLVYLNPLCLGLTAVYFSIKSRDRKLVGDLETAREYGSTARCLNITALILLIIGAGMTIFFWKYI